MTRAGEIAKKIVLCFGTAKEIAYENLQALVLGEVSTRAREEVSFDHRLNYLIEKGYLKEVRHKQKNKQGKIVHFRGYALTKEGRSFLLYIQKEKNERERLRKLGKPLPKNKRGGDRWTSIKGKKNKHE